MDGRRFGGHGIVALSRMGRAMHRPTPPRALGDEVAADEAGRARDQYRRSDRRSSLCLQFTRRGGARVLIVPNVTLPLPV